MSTNFPISSGGFCKSASSVTTYAPRAYAKPRNHGRMLAEIGVKHPQPRLLRALRKLLPQKRHRAILAAIVDEHDFVGNLERIQRRIQPREQRRQHGFFVVNRNHDAELGMGKHSCLTLPYSMVCGDGAVRFEHSPALCG